MRFENTTVPGKRGVHHKLTVDGKLVGDLWLDDTQSELSSQISAAGCVEVVSQAGGRLEAVA